MNSTPRHFRSGQGTRHRTLMAVAWLFFLITVHGCVPEELTDYDYKQFQPPSTLPVDKGDVKVGEAAVAGVKVALYIDKGAHTGYNRLRVMLTDAGSETIFTDALVELEPSYIVASKEIAVPFENPSSTKTNPDGFFEGSALFLPHGEAVGTFSIAINFEISDAQKGRVDFPLSVEESLWMQRVETPTGRYYVSWVHPARPEVGKNVFEVDLQQEIEGGYAPINGASLDLYPYMDMGGGDGHSTPFEQPVYTSEGRYRGSVDFIMAGGWEMTVYVGRDDAPRESVLFDGYRVY